MSRETLCVVCTDSAENIKGLLSSFDRQNDASGLTLHVSTCRGRENYPPPGFISEYLAGGAPSFIVFIRDTAELYGSDFLSRLIAPLRRDPGINFAIPSTVIPHEASHYQLSLSFSERRYGIPLCNATTGFSPDRFGVFSGHVVLAVAMRFPFYLQVQENCPVLVNPADFNILPSLTKRYPGSVAVAPQCAAYLPKFQSFMDLWKIFYGHGKNDAWFDAGNRKYRSARPEFFRSFYSAAYYCGYARQYAGSLRAKKA